MQPNSIPEPLRPANERTQPTFPASGDNFTTMACLDDVPDTLALLEAIGWLEDYRIALADFEEKHCTGTVLTPLTKAM